MKWPTDVMNVGQVNDEGVPLDTTVTPPSDNKRFGGVTTLHDNNKTKTIGI
jgi:hypothetical protein